MSGYGVTFAQLEAKKRALEGAQAFRNAQKIRRVAASLPACVVPEGQCPLHNSTKPQEFAAPGASTTTTLSGESRGCSAHGRA